MSYLNIRFSQLAHSSKGSSLPCGGKRKYAGERAAFRRVEVFRAWQGEINMQTLFKDVCTAEWNIEPLHTSQECSGEGVHFDEKFTGASRHQNQWMNFFQPCVVEALL